jgi:hypothetical protein
VGTDGQVQVRIAGDEVRAQLDHCRRWDVDLQVAQERGGEPFIDENAAMLRIVGEFANIEVAVVSLNQVRLRAPAHFADQSAGANRHADSEMSESMEEHLQKKESKGRMADTTEGQDSKPGANPDEIALELMKFIAVTTGYGRGPAGAGFQSKGPRSGEEYADCLLELFDRCRERVRKEPK